jgi:Major Facilitator Superfamily
VLATLGLGVLTYGITRPRTHGWGSPEALVLVTAGILALAAFAVVEARLARTPLIPPRLLRRRAILTGNLAMLLAGACLNPMWFFLTLYMQGVLHYDPLRTGLAFLPHTLVTIAVGARLTPWAMRHVSARTLVVVGAAVAAAGFVWQSRMTPDSGYLAGILGPAIVFSVGGGLLNTPLTTTVTTGVERADAGAASGVMNTAKQVGGALGLAVLDTVAASSSRAPAALAAGYGRAFVVIAAVLAVVAALAVTFPSSRDAAELTAGHPGGR